jgi:GNAT superfamily N-acetyltransferase
MTETGKDTLNIRRASAADAPAVLALFDEVIEWFVSIGNLQQWGSEPWSTTAPDHPGDRCVRAARRMGGAERARVVRSWRWASRCPMPAPTGPELYVRVLVASRDVRVRGIGRRLMAFADEQARAAGLDHLRVDCYGGGSGDLVRFYESCGYTRIAPFNVDGWPACCWATALTRLRHSVAACVQETVHRFGARVGHDLQDGCVIPLRFLMTPPGRSSACTTAVATTKPARPRKPPVSMASAPGSSVRAWPRWPAPRSWCATAAWPVSASPSSSSSRFLGGALDGLKVPEKGFVIRGGREMEDHFECLWDLFRSIPSLEIEDASVLDEFYWLNKDDPNYSLQRATINRGEDAHTDGLFTLTEQAQKDIIALFLATRQEMENKRIDEVLGRDFLDSNFWLYWRTMFAFEEWHSALEMKLYLHRFIHHIGGLPDFSALKFTKYNQYESLVLPLVKWLQDQGVVFQYGTEVTDVDFLQPAASRPRASTA